MERELHHEHSHNWCCLVWVPSRAVLWYYVVLSCIVLFCGLRGVLLCCGVVYCAVC